MAMYNQRPILSGRIPELLDTLKTEFETVAHDVNMYKMQRDDYERKLQSQLTELNTIQTTLFELERTHTKIKQQYEEEILRLRRQVDLQVGSHSDQPPLLPRSASTSSSPIDLDKSHQIPNGPSSVPSVFYPAAPGLTSPDKRRFNPTSSPLPSPTTTPPSAIPSPLAKRPRPNDSDLSSTHSPNTSLSASGLASLYSQQNHLPHHQGVSHPSQGSQTFPPLAPLALPNGNNASGSNGNGLGPSMMGLGPNSSSSSNSIMDATERSLKHLKTNSGQVSGSSGTVGNGASGGGNNVGNNGEKEGIDGRGAMNLSVSVKEVPRNLSPSLHSLPSIMERQSKDHQSASSSPPSTLPSSAASVVFETKKIQQNESPEEANAIKSENSAKKTEWIVGYNPSVPSVLSFDLGYTFEHSSVVCCVKFSNDGKYLATGCNRSTQIYDVHTGEKASLFADDNAKDGDLYIRSVCFSPDGSYLAAGAEDKTVKLWDIEKKRVAHTFVGHELDIYSLDWSQDGRFIVSGSGDKKTKVWDREKMKCVLTLGNEEVGPKDGVTSVAISPDGRLVAAGSLDRIVRLWDTSTGYFLDRFEGHLDSVYSVAFSPDGKTLASGSLDKTLKLWDLNLNRNRTRCRSTFTGHKDFVLSVAFSQDGNWLVSGSKDRTVQFWDPRTAVTYMMLQGHKNSVISVALSPAGGMFATGSGDFLARLWRYDARPSLLNSGAK